MKLLSLFIAVTFLYNPGPSSFVKMQSKASAARKFAAAKKFNTQICFLIDMSVSSGKRRFFIYDLQHDCIISSGLVTNGRRGRYSNEIGSNCTSTGKYKIGKPYRGVFGLAYKLYGLEATNSNAFARFVVLHSMECVPDVEVGPLPICESNGCPALSAAFLKTVSKYIDASPKPVLLWIYE